MTGKKKILLMMLPFWTPLIPPMGIASIKSFLKEHGYTVKTSDGNVQPELWEIKNRYFDTLKAFIPEENRGNFYNIGFNVLRNHLMAYLNRRDDEEHFKLVKTIVYQHYYRDIDNGQVAELDNLLGIFYARLEKYVLKFIDEEEPQYFGLSALSGNLAPSLFAFRLVKKNFPQIKTVMGGGVFSDQLLLGSPDLDYFLDRTEAFIDKIMIGESQLLWLKYLAGELPALERVYTATHLKGETLDMSYSIIPDYSEFGLQYYPYLGATGSKSCPFKCSFCNVAAFWGDYKKKNPAQTVSEMLELYSKYGQQLFFMTDSLLNPIIDEISERFMNCDVSIYWDGYLRVADAVCDVENTLRWRRAGFYRARFGIESGSQHVLDMMGKNITPEQSKVALAALANAGIKTTAYCVIGHPGETEEDFQDTLDFIEEMKDDIWEVECNPFGYYYGGQNNSDIWAEKRQLLYPENARDILVSQSWTLEGEPTRETVYQRVFRFAQHCLNLGIPNPYSMQELYEADERWKKLHAHAVPGLVEFGQGAYIDENKKVNRLLCAEKSIAFDKDFVF